MTTAFVLSGGGSLGAVEVGMVLALADRGIEPELIVGTSVGAINAAYLAGGRGLARADGLAAVWRGLSRRSVFPMPPSRLVGAAAGRASSLADPGRLRVLLTQHLGYQRIEDSPTRLAVVATDVLTGEEVVAKEGDVVANVMASAALPAVFPAVEVDGRMLMDGGVVNNTPISVARDLGADTIYVLPTGYACALKQPPRSALGIAMHAVTLAIQQRLVSEIRALPADLDLRVVPTLCPLAVAPIDFRQTTELIGRALESTRRWLDRPLPEDQAGSIALHRHPV